MGCLFVIVLWAVSAALIHFFGYHDWALIVAGLLWLGALVMSLLRGHQGFGGHGNTDLQAVVAGLLIAVLLIFPGYAEQKHCDQAKEALAELAKAEDDYFAGHKVYTTGADLLSLMPNPNIQIKVIRADERSFLASASHSLCNREKDGTPEVFLWDSSRGGLQ